MAQEIGGWCSCGFDAGQLISGVLMSGESYKIVACYECQIIRSIKNEDSSLEICEQCRHATSDVGYCGGGNYCCPLCLKSELYLQPNLMAD